MFASPTLPPTGVQSDTKGKKLRYKRVPRSLTILAKESASKSFLPRVHNSSNSGAC